MNYETLRQDLDYWLFSWVVSDSYQGIEGLALLAPPLRPIQSTRAAVAWRAASGPVLAGRISRTHRRGENIISGSKPFLIFRLHYGVLQTSWVANSIANALNTTLLRPVRHWGRAKTPIYLNFYPDSIWEIVLPAALAKLRRQRDCARAGRLIM